MVYVNLVPSGHEVVSIDGDGNETLTKSCTLERAFSRAISGMDLRERTRGVAGNKRLLSGAEDADQGEEEGSGKTKSMAKDGGKDPTDAQLNPFLEAQNELFSACQELQQLHELVELLCQDKYFRLDNTQANPPSNVSQFTDIWVSIELKKIMLDEALSIFRKGKLMLCSGTKTMREYISLVESLQKRWRIHAVAHSSGGYGPLSIQEPLAVDCGYYSAGGRVHKRRRHRSTARILVEPTNEDDNVNMQSAFERVRLDVNPDLFRTIKFSVHSHESSEVLGYHVMSQSSHEAGGLSCAPETETEIDKTLEPLRNSEFCRELFKVLSVEAVKVGEFSSSRAVEDGDFGHAREKVCMVDIRLDHLVIVLDKDIELKISLVPVEDAAVPACTLNSNNQGHLTTFCRMASFLAENHLRSVHCGRFNTPALQSMVDLYKQRVAFQELSIAVDQMSHILSTGNNLIRLKVSWTHRESDSYLEVRVGPEVVVRCKLTRGRLRLGSIAIAGTRKLHEDWSAAQRNEMLFANPNQVETLKSFIVGIAKHEILYVLKRRIETATSIYPKRFTFLIAQDSSTLSWFDKERKASLSADADQSYIRIQSEKDFSLKIFAGTEELRQVTVKEIIRRIIG